MRFHNNVEGQAMQYNMSQRGCERTAAIQYYNNVEGIGRSICCCASGSKAMQLYDVAEGINHAIVNGIVEGMSHAMYNSVVAGNIVM